MKLVQIKQRVAKPKMSSRILNVFAVDHTMLVEKQEHRTIITLMTGVLNFPFQTGNYIVIRTFGQDKVLGLLLSNRFYIKSMRFLVNTM